MKQDRFFEVTLTQNWMETVLGHTHAFNHKEAAKVLPLINKRVTNDRFREIERNGSYYRITEMKKGGKAFIFEIFKTNNNG